MPTPAIIATAGASNANSYETLLEAQAYFDARLPVAGWDDADDQNVLLLMATRVLNAIAMPFKQLIPASGGNPAYYRIRRTWTGAPATTTQALAWPRTGMYDANGNAIPSNVIPQALKDAESELAGQLGTADRTLDNDVIVQGITSVRAGSVALTFKDMIETRVLPDAVWNLMPPSWFTDELIVPAWPAQFDVIQS
jgi:hypothetical protein